jgi:hypothetical protein
MVIGDRLRELREQKNFSQGDIENRFSACEQARRVYHGAVFKGKKEIPVNIISSLMIMPLPILISRLHLARAATQPREM